MISIHAPRAGRDCSPISGVCLTLGISIHAPRAGRDGRLLWSRPLPKVFQATRPVRGATRAAEAIQAYSGYFNPRAPCGARRAYNTNCYMWYYISIHAPRAGRDAFPAGAEQRCNQHFNPRAPCGARRKSGSSVKNQPIFQSTRPVRGATAKVYKITLHTFATKGNF